jgi:hypothetical protein
LQLFAARFAEIAQWIHGIMPQQMLHLKERLVRLQVGVNDLSDYVLCGSITGSEHNTPGEDRMDANKLGNFRLVTLEASAYSLDASSINILHGLWRRRLQARPPSLEMLASAKW